jgi:hypothetical protein
MPTTTKIVTALFTLAGAPKTGLSPTVQIQRISDDTRVVTAGAMVELVDGASLGVYKFDFTAFDNAEDYAFKADAIVTAPVNVDSQFAYGILSETREQIADQVWDEAEADHVAAGSTGLAMKIARTFLQNKRILRELSATNFEYEVFEDGGAAIFLQGTITESGAEDIRSEAS